MKNPHKKTCAATNKNGTPCRSWTLPGSLYCSSHTLPPAPNVGAPAGNTNSLKHGAYSPHFTNDEAVRLITHAANLTLDDEIAVTRVITDRLLAYLSANTDDLTIIAPLLLNSTRTTARLLRDKRALSGTAADGLMDAIGAALDELSTEWGIEI